MTKLSAKPGTWCGVFIAVMTMAAVAGFARAVEAVIDLNAIESNDAPVKKPGSFVALELVRLTSGNCTANAARCRTSPSPISPSSPTPRSAVPGSSEIQVFALDPHRGVLDLRVDPPADELQRFGGVIHLLYRRRAQ